MKNKRGQGMSTQTIILLVLGVIVLAVLVIGFIVGWSNIAPWIPSSNVDSISKACDVACSTGSVYAFCSEPRDLKVSGEPDIEDTTCAKLAENYPEYGIAKCSDITCPAE